MISEHISIPTPAGRRMRALLLRPRGQTGSLPGILWIHGGGYSTGMPAMAYVSVGARLARTYGAVVLSPGYRLSGTAPYPAAFEDCCAALRYMTEHTEELGIDPSRIIVGGESAGGGLAAAVCLYARDNRIPVALQLPVYPMLDCSDTESSKDNHGIVWNTRRNHRGWKKYLGPLSGAEAVPKYASPAKETDYSGLPPCLTFVLDGEPFLSETLAYAAQLRSAGVSAEVQVYHGRVHGFDLYGFLPHAKEAREWITVQAKPWFAARGAADTCRAPEP